MDDRAIGDGVSPDRTARPRPASTGRANRSFGLVYAVGMMIGGAFALGSGTADAARVCPSMTITVSADGLSDRIGCEILDPLPMAEVTTDTPWTDGPSRFEGYPPVRVADRSWPGRPRHRGSGLERLQRDPVLGPDRHLSTRLGDRAGRPPIVRPLGRSILVGSSVRRSRRTSERHAFLQGGLATGQDRRQRQ